jgi:hypothetical protein
MFIIDRDFEKAAEYAYTGPLGNYYRAGNTMPKELQDAVCEQALHYIKLQAGEYTVDENDLETLTSLKIGPIDMAIKSNVKADRLPTRVKQLLVAIGPNGWTGERPLKYDR